MDLQLKDKRAIVTGGTRGIGRAIADTLAGEGCNVAICARNVDQVSEAVDALKSKGVSAFGGVVDIADGEALKAWIVKAGGELGGLDILVSSAGAMAMGADEASWKKNLQIDIFGAVNSVEAALPMLEESAKENGDAAIVAIGSTAAVNATEPSSYGAIKGAMVHYIKGLARQNAPKHVRANVVSPGMVYFEGGVWHRVEQRAPEYFEASFTRNPMGRMATPQDIANAAVFLASPCSSFTTGINMIVDGTITDRANY
ncbi:MAG: SDR family oxidoreductase [Deltaproteobacteria bacterium]|nr:SDR family oxidoreductase [Deltaproteobacteria bacterium]MBW2053384.1 SDR family oxidoreductase [Deltaproteobacteria bacterium]MBW2141420.1 SDR family oxidoreductase [Deltaproteobacteria bacterium]MBW2324235.1 SDR family oxidoreductase [Deltaproteobacteria bacterium]